MPLPGNPDTFQFVEAQCGEAKDITVCIEEKTFNQSAIIKNVILGFSSQTSLIDQDLGTEDFTSSYHGMAHTLNMDTKINPDDSTSQLFLIFQDLSNYQVYSASCTWYTFPPGVHPRQGLLPDQRQPVQPAQPHSKVVPFDHL